jgi:hypothetical protein
MPYEFSWVLPQRVMLVRIYGEVTAKEMEQIDTQTLTAVMEGTPPVHGIVNTLDVISVPVNLKTMTRTFRGIHPNAGITIMISQNPLYHFFLNIITQLNHAETHTAKTYVEAIEKLRRLDPTLAEMMPE